MENFWPKITKTKTDTPLALIKQQGKFLEEHTSGVLTYHINKKPTEKKGAQSGKAMRYDFYINAPHMDNFKFMLFYVIHDLVVVYPATIVYYTDDEPQQVHSKEEFEAALKNILSKESTKNILESLLAQSES